MVSFQIVDFLVMFYASIFPFYMAYRLRKKSGGIFYLSTLLGSMAFIHSLFHLSLYFQNIPLASFLQMLSVLLILVFAFYLLWSGV
jgi:hypothetical protein